MLAPVIAVEAERVTAVVLAAMTGPLAAAVVMVSSKHVCFRSCFVISK